VPIDPNEALAAPALETAISWQIDDVLLYNLATGSGIDPTAKGELRFATEWNTQVLPSFAVVAPTLRATEPPSLNRPGIEIDLRRILHGSQRVQVLRPLPAQGVAVARQRISQVQDKGKAAVIDFQTTASTPDGELLWTSTMGIFARGEGGFGGERGHTLTIAVPERAPDQQVTVRTLPQQALLYRLLGDRNPLHADPEVAQAMGFDRPILHGLCSYALVLRALVREMLGDDVASVSTYTGLFTGVVLPGENLTLFIWDDSVPETGERRIVVVATVKERDDAPALTAELTCRSSD
jgi:acyl dehydratase